MLVNTSEDCAIIREVLSGRTDAFRALVERYFATVRLVAIAKTGNAADAEDVAQETFIKAYETLGVLRNRERLAPWLVAIARNIAISLVRRRERERRNAEACPIDSMVHPDHERRETLDAVARQVEALPENLREVVLLHYFEGLKCREIGERLDLNTNAVVKRLARGRELLGDRLLREWGEGARPETGKPGVGRVMGAIVLLPRPDWKAQLAGMGGAGTALKAGGLAAALLGPPLAFKVFTAVSVAALGVLYVSLNVRGGSDESPTASAGTSAPVSDRGLIAAATSGMGETLKSTFTDDKDGLVWVAIEPVAPVPMAEVGFVSGVVVETDGAPVRDALVWAGGGENTGKATSNPNGEFRINVSAPVPKIEAGAVSKHVSLTCSMPGFVPRTVADLRLGTTDVQVVLARPAVVLGKVVDATTGAPIKQFSLRIDWRSPKDPETGQSANPHWQATHTAAGEFRLEAAYGLTAFDVIAEGYVGKSVEASLVQGETAEGLVVALEPGGKVRGIVLDKATSLPVPGASVGLIPRLQPVAEEMIPVQIREDFRVKTRRDGSFTFTELPLNTPVELGVQSQGYRRELLNVIATASSEPEPLTVYLERGGSIRGRLFYNGGPPPGCDEAKITDGYCSIAVAAPGEYGYAGSGFARPDGTYEITGLHDGTYQVNASFRVNRTGVHGESISKRVTVRDGEATELDIDFDAPAGNIALEVVGLGAVGGVQMELHSTRDSLMLLSKFLSQPGPLRPKAVPGATLEPVLEYAYTVPTTVTLPTLEPGEYLLRFYQPEDEDGAIEESILVVAGQTTELNVDLSTMAEELVGGETVDEPGEEATGDLAVTVEAP